MVVTYLIHLHTSNSQSSAEKKHQLQKDIMIVYKKFTNTFFYIVGAN